MAFIVDEETGDITLVQGDSGKLIVEGLPTDKNYTVYFSVYDDKRKPVASEVFMSTSGSSIVTLVIPAELTDLLKVPQGEDSSEYYYGLKLCHEDSGLEDTLSIGDKNPWDLKTMTVYPKQVEGTTNG